MEDNTMYFLYMSLGSNLFFFVAIFMQHLAIENEARENRALRKQVDYWQRKYVMSRARPSV